MDELRDKLAERAPAPEVSELQKQVNKYRRLARKHRANVELVTRVLAEIWEEPPDLEVPPAPKASRKALHEVAVLHYTDAQIGKITDTYDSVVAEERAVQLIQKAIEVTEVRRSASQIDELRLYLGGDIVEGEGIFPTQPHHIDSSVFRQAVHTAPGVITRIVTAALGAFRRVRVVAVPGNHGRTSKFNHPESNWDRVAYEVARMILLGTEAHPRKGVDKRLQFHTARTFWAVDYVYDWGNLIVHGDQIRGGFAGFPFYGVGKKAAGWKDTPQIPPWDYLWFGHFHTDTKGTLNTKQYLAGGTTESSNDYALENLAAAGYPVQRLAFFSPKHGLIADNPIYLTDDRRPARTLKPDLDAEVVS